MNLRSPSTQVDDLLPEARAFVDQVLTDHPSLKFKSWSVEALDCLTCHADGPVYVFRFFSRISGDRCYTRRCTDMEACQFRMSVRSDPPTTDKSLPKQDSWRLE